jgi:hypothetical protein
MPSQSLLQSGGGSGSHSRRGTGGGGLIAFQKRLRTESPIEFHNYNSRQPHADGFNAMMWHPCHAPP